MTSCQTSGFDSTIADTISARCTCAPELVGGAEASQKGFGDRIPVKLMRRSAMCFQPFLNRARREFSILHRHYGGGRSARAYAISAGKHSRQTGFEVAIHMNETLVRLQTKLGNQRRLLLPDRFHKLLRLQHKV